MIDFSKIHGFQAGQRHSFEELVCQLARREEYPADAEFRRVEGAGGDGGVEAYWKKADDREIGYQAKYFLRTGDIDWGQVDESVSQAIITHKELEEYVIALPCDLTDRSGKQQKGKTGWDHWDAHVAKWQKQAAEQGNSSIKFTVWPQSELLTRLTKLTAEGLRQYWFGEVEFSQRWFREHVQEGIVSLDERFHPEDHVDVRIQKLFSVIARHPSYVDELKSKLSAISENTLSNNQFSGLPQQPNPALLANLSKAQQQLFAVQEDFALPLHKDWNIDQWIRFADELLSLLDTLLDWCWEYAKKLERENPANNEIYRQRSELSSLKESVEEFRSLCTSEFMQAEQGRLAFIEGRAGTGKRHPELRKKVEPSFLRLDNA